MRGLIETLVVTTGCTQYLSELSSAVGSKLSASAFWSICAVIFLELYVQFTTVKKEKMRSSSSSVTEFFFSPCRTPAEVPV